MHRTNSAASKWNAWGIAAGLAFAAAPIWAYGATESPPPGAPLLPPAAEMLPPPGMEVDLAGEADDVNASWLRLDQQPVTSGDFVKSTEELEPLPGEFDKTAQSLVYFGGGPPPAYSFGYNRVRSATTWLPGHDDRFGWFSYESFGGARVNEWPSLISGFGVHFLDGPVRTDMPPRLFDFSIGVADRRLIRQNVGYDIVFRAGAFSDFEGSAEDGVRFPSHAVTFWRMNRRVELVLGVDYLDRDDITILPVAGAIWSPAEWLRVEAVFPRPRLAAQILGSKQWIFLGGELGGGTWAIERVGFTDDNATYRDLRLVLGWEGVDDDALSTSFEIGYVFDRDLSYRSRDGDYQPPDGIMLRMTARY